MATNRAGSRDRLLAAAKALMARDGYEQTTTSAIAREAGTSESQLVRYFGNKPGLLQAIFDEAWIPLNVRIAQAIDSTSSGRDAVLAIFGLFLTALQADTELATLMIFEGRRIRPSGEKSVAMSHGFLEFEATLSCLIGRCQEESSFDPALNAAAIYAAIVGMVEGMIRDRMVQRRIGHRSPYNTEDVRLVFGAMLGGLEPSARGS